MRCGADGYSIVAPFDRARTVVETGRTQVKLSWVNSSTSVHSKFVPPQQCQLHCRRYVLVCPEEKRTPATTAAAGVLADRRLSQSGRSSHLPR